MSDDIIKRARCANVQSKKFEIARGSARAHHNKVFERLNDGYTSVLRDLWQRRRSVTSVVDMGIPQFIIDKKIPVYDAVKFASAKDPVDLAKFFPPVPPRRESEWAYMIGHKTRLLEGPLQAQILTNSIAHSKLPQEYEDAFNAMSVSDDEIKWFQDRLEIINLDSKQFKLPHKIDPERTAMFYQTGPQRWPTSFKFAEVVRPRGFVHEKCTGRPWHRFPRQYGPGIGRNTLELLSAFNDFVRLENSNRTSGAAYKPLVHEVSCQYIGPPKPNFDGTPGVNPYVYQGFASSVATTSRPLGVLTSSDSSSDSGPTGCLPSMYPALPEMDLSKKFDYEPKNIYPISSSPATKGDAESSTLSLHTLFITHPWNNDDWKPSEKLGRAIMQSFTFAAAHTVGRLGEAASANGNGLLPIADRFRLQTVYHDMNTVGFIVYNLNTLNAASSGDPEGTARNELYHECAHLRENEELNPRVLKWLKVFYET